MAMDIDWFCFLPTNNNYNHVDGKYVPNWWKHEQFIFLEHVNGVFHDDAKFAIWDEKKISIN